MRFICDPQKKTTHTTTRKATERLFFTNDAIINDALNHASIIDNIRLCKAKRYYRYANNNMPDLEAHFKQVDQDDTITKLIVTDGVCSRDGICQP